MFSIQINEHLLTGEKRRGKWKFQCNTWPDIADLHNDSVWPHYAIEMFADRAVRLLIVSMPVK